MDDLALAAGLVMDAGRLADRMLREGLTTEHKTSVSDVVSAADRAAEELIAGRLATERPDDAVVGEEGTSRAGTGRTWFVDPVDGTYNFLSGLAGWCSAVALLDEDGSVLGAVYAPRADELWLGGRHVPTTVNGVEVARLVDRPLGQVSLATYLHPPDLPSATTREPLLAAFAQAATLRMLGSGSVDLAGVAGGRLGCFLQVGCLPWDWWPGVALVEGAGGVAEVVTLGGRDFHVAGNAQTVREAVEALRSGAA